MAYHTLSYGLLELVGIGPQENGLADLPGH